MLAHDAFQGLLIVGLQPERDPFPGSVLLGVSATLSVARH